MDVPIILDSFGTKLIGSSSSHNLVKNYYSYHKLDSTGLNKQLVFASNNEHESGDIKFHLLEANHSVPMNLLKRSLQNLAAPLCPNGENCQEIKPDTPLNFDEIRWTKRLLHGQAYNLLVRYKNSYFYFYNGLETCNAKLKNLFDEANNLGQELNIHVFIATPAYRALINSNQANVITNFWAQFSGFSRVKVHPMHWDNFFNPIEQSTLPKFPSFIDKDNNETHDKLHQHVESELKERGKCELINKVGKVDIQFF